METMSPAANQHTIVRPFANELDKKNLPAPFAPSKSKEKMEGKKRKKIDSPYPCLRMKTDENGRENPLTISVSVFYNGKRERERNSWVRKRDITVTKTGKFTGMHYYLITIHFA